MVANGLSHGQFQVGMVTKEDKRNLIMLLSIGIFAYLFALNAPLTDGDSVFYADIAKRIVDTGDWVVMKSDVMTLVDKPPLSIWPIAVSYALMGDRPAAVRTWHVLIAVSSVLLTYLIAREFFDSKTSLWSAIVLLSTILFFYMGFVPQQDIPALFILLLGMLFFVKWAKNGSLLSFYAVWVSLGLSLLNRGLGGFLVEAPILGVTFVVVVTLGRSKVVLFRTLRSWVLHTVAGVALMSAVAGPWYLLAYQRQGFQIINLLLLSGNSRFFEANAGYSGGASMIGTVLRWLSYFPMLVAGLLPWSALLWMGLEDSIRRMRQDRSLGDVIMFAWTVTAFITPMAIQWRVIRYLIPAFPPLAVLIGKAISDVLATEGESGRLSRGGSSPLERPAKMVLGIVLPLFALTVVYAVAQFRTEVPEYLPVVLPILLALPLSQVAFAYLALKRKYRAAFVSAAATSMVGLVIAMVLLPRYWNGL